VGGVDTRRCRVQLQFGPYFDPAEGDIDFPGTVHPPTRHVEGVARHGHVGELRAQHERRLGGVDEDVVGRVKLRVGGRVGAAQPLGNGEGPLKGTPGRVVPDISLLRHPPRTSIWLPLQPGMAHSDTLAYTFQLDVLTAGPSNSSLQVSFHDPGAAAASATAAVSAAAEARATVGTTRTICLR
jgi:hypothetical protein